MRLSVTFLFALITAAGCQMVDEGGTPSQLPGPPISTDLSDLVGVRASSGEIALRNRGYHFVRAEGLTTFHFNAAARYCARVLTSGGRFESINKVQPRQCRAGETPSQLPGNALVPGTGFNASGSIRCTLDGRSRECEYGVVWKGRGNANVYITRPLRLDRRIEFVSGRPVSSNNGPVYGEWRADNVIVTVNKKERYVVPNSVLFGG